MKLIINKKEFDLESKEELIKRIKENSKRGSYSISLEDTRGSKISVLINTMNRMACVYFNGVKKYYSKSSEPAFFHMNGSMFSDNQVVSSAQGFDALEFFYDTGLCQMDQPDKRDNEILM